MGVAPPFKRKKAHMKGISQGRKKNVKNTFRTADRHFLQDMLDEFRDTHFFCGEDSIWI